jgi:hypothetical protein
MLSGHKTDSVFNRYNIVSEEDLRLAAKRQEVYLKAQRDTISNTISQLDAKKAQLGGAEPFSNPPLSL